MTNKAHAAVVRRLIERYGTKGKTVKGLSGKVFPPCLDGSADGFDVHFGDLIIEVETSATIGSAIEKLAKAHGRRFIAVTNRESIDDALALTTPTDIGVMDPWGEVVREAGHDHRAAG